PVRPNPTQQTLYGSTLRPFVVGELIAGALRDKLDARPDVLFVDHPDAMNAQTWGEIPVFCFRKMESGTLIKFRDYQFWRSEPASAQLDKVLQLLEKHVPETADLREPLLRVEQALKEAMGQAA